MIIDNLIELNTIEKSRLLAEPSHVLTTKTYVGKAGLEETGTMPNIGAVNVTLNAGQSYKPTLGYHNGQGTITAKTLAEQTIATAGASHILAPYTAWVTGGKVTGTMVNRTGWTSSVAMNGSVVIPQGYHDGTKSVTGPAITNRGAWTYRLSANGKVTIPEGYHNGSGYVDQALTGKGAATYTPSTVNQTIAANQWLTGAQTILGDADLIPENIREGVTIFGKVGTAKCLPSGPNDIYNRGTNPYGFKVGTFINAGAQMSVDVGQLTITRIGRLVDSTGYGSFITTQSVNLFGYSKLNIEHSVNISGAGAACWINVGNKTIYDDSVMDEGANFPTTVDLTQYQFAGVLEFRFSAYEPLSSGSAGEISGPIYRVWLE